MVLVKPFKPGPHTGGGSAGARIDPLRQPPRAHRAAAMHALAESPAAALQEARGARDSFFDAHVVERGAGRRRPHPSRASGESEPTEGPLLVAALCRELTDISRMLRLATAALTEEKALSAQLRTAAQRLDAQLVALCASGRRPAPRPALHEAQTQEPPTGEPQHGSAQVQTEPARPGGSARTEESPGRRATGANWADASCQIGWSESVADKSCQAHDVDAAISRIRWAARDLLHRKAAVGALQQVATPLYRVIYCKRAISLSTILPKPPPPEVT